MQTRSNLLSFSLAILMAGCSSSPDPAATMQQNQVPEDRDTVQMDVPMVLQSDARLTDAACMEMVLSYWGETRYNQLEIARAMVWKYQKHRRFTKSHTLFQIRSGKSAEEMDWSSYPGSGTAYVREFLEIHAPTDNPRIERLPTNPVAANQVAQSSLEKLKGNLNLERPVIVYQYADREKEAELFRVVTGFDSKKEILYINDPFSGKTTMSESLFMTLWNVDGPWNSYNSIIFNHGTTLPSSRGTLKFSIELPPVN